MRTRLGGSGLGESGKGSWYFHVSCREIFQLVVSNPNVFNDGNRRYGFIPKLLAYLFSGLLN